MALLVAVVALGGLNYYTLTSEKAALSSQINSTNVTLSASFGSLRNSLSTLQSQLSQVQQAESSDAEQIAALQTDLTTLHDQLANVSDELNSTRSSDLSFQTQVSAQLQNITATINAITVKLNSIQPQLPDNVTIQFTQVSGSFSYTINAGNAGYMGAHDTNMTTTFQIPEAYVYQGETITISASETGLGSCASEQTVTAKLYLNGQVVVQGTAVCAGSDIQISYTI